MLASEAAALELSGEALWVPMTTCSVNIVPVFLVRLVRDSGFAGGC